MDWLLVAAYLGALVVILLLAAGLLYVICYLTNPTEEETPAEILTEQIKSEVKAEKEAKSKSKPVAVGEQTMVSSLRKSASDNDVVIATAISSIPVRELGGKSNDIIVDVSQQMYLDKDLKGHDEHNCIVCNTRKDIAWNQVSCYAQTTIGVLVYKRRVDEDPSSPQQQQQQKQQQQASTPKLNSVTSPRLQLIQAQDLSLAPFNERSRSVSTTTLAPDPDSRLSLKSVSKTKPSSSKSPIKSPKLTTSN